MDGIGEANDPRRPVPATLLAGLALGLHPGRGPVGVVAVEVDLQVRLAGILVPDPDDDGRVHVASCDAVAGVRDVTGPARLAWLERAGLRSLQRVRGGVAASAVDVVRVPLGERAKNGAATW